MMRIRSWGSRGSLPVSGKEFLFYGGDTSCVEIRTQNNYTIIIDAGTGIRNLGRKFLAKNLPNANLLLTHFHMDHIMGFPFFAPIYKKDFQLKIYGPLKIKETLLKAFSNKLFPKDISSLESNINFIEIPTELDPFIIDNITITPIKISHPQGGLAYKFTENNKNFVIFPDNNLGFIHNQGHSKDIYLKFIENSDLVFHDAYFTPEEYLKTWGHSSYLQALTLAIDANIKRLGLFHHLPDRTDAEIGKILAHCQSQIQKRNSNLRCFAVSSNTEIIL